MTISDSDYLRLQNAFPAQLRELLQPVFASLPSAEYSVSVEVIEHVIVDGERLTIPNRVHFPEHAFAEIAHFSAIQQQAFACIFTRHHNGFVRERAVRYLLNDPAAWAVPYIIRLLGEYVVEIAELAAAREASWHTATVTRFVVENPTFLRRTRDRAISYWNEYYRPRWWKAADYPAARVLRALEQRARALT